MIFYYVRHGDPIYEPDSLTELGHKQANALSKRFALYGLDQIYCSTSNRAMLTAEPTCKLLNKEKVLLPWTNEGYIWNFCSVDKDDLGNKCWIFFNKKYRDLFNSPEIRALGDDWCSHPDIPQNLKDGVKIINKEVDDFMLSLGFKHDRVNSTFTKVSSGPAPERVALFAHEGCGKMFLSSLLDMPYPYVSTHLELGHSSVTTIYIPEDCERPRIMQWSNDSHLYKEGVLSAYQNWIDL
ncbi:MAG: histidine phosphatase family protein [Clostridia bacterium]|nr:histidine phosphatase family protein [Clostridia bacterium]